MKDLFHKYLKKKCLKMLHPLVALCISGAKSWRHNDVNGAKWYGRPWKQWKTIELSWYVIKLSGDMWYRRSIHSCISWAYSIIHWRVWENKPCLLYVSLQGSCISGALYFSPRRPWCGSLSVRGWIQTPMVNRASLIHTNSWSELYVCHPLYHMP